MNQNNDYAEIHGCISVLVGYTRPELPTVTTPKVVPDKNGALLSASLRPGEDEPQRDTPRPGMGRAAVLFSFPVMCMFLLGAVIFAFCVKQFAEPDIWWHLRDGAYFWQHHSFPAVDTYSFGAAGSPWLDHEWLSEVPFFLGFRTMGLPGVLLVYFAVLVFIYSAVYYRSCSAGADCKDASIATLFAILLGVVSIGPRVLLFGWLCMVGLLLVLDRFKRTGKGIWALPPLFALWINLHASWVFGFVVLGLVTASALIQGEWGAVEAHRWSPGELKKLALASTVSLAALFVNPFGYKLVLYPFNFLFHQQSNVQYVEEWQSVDLSTGNGKLAMIVIVGLLAAGLFSRRRWKLDEVLLIAFALWTGLLHARFLFFVGLIVIPILAPHLKLFLPYDWELDKPLLNAAIMACILGSIIFFFPSSAQLQQKVGGTFPTAAVQFMQSHQLHGRIFNQYLWGGYLEWTAPELQTFIDGRADIFVYNGVLDDHRRATSIEAPLEVMDKYDIDLALLQPDRPLTYMLQHAPGWQQAYQDNVAVVVERVSAPVPSTSQPDVHSK